MNNHILVVEDDDTLRLGYSVVLESAGYQVQQATDGETAIALLDQSVADGPEYDVVVTDIRMGSIDGIEVTTTARSQYMPPEVILVTGYGSLDTSIAALRAGAFDYLLKPCHAPDLLNCVARAIERRADTLRRMTMLQQIVQVVQEVQNPDAPDQPPEPSADDVQQKRDTVTNNTYEVGDLSLDGPGRTVTVTLDDGTRTHRLTPTENVLVCTLAQQPGRVMEFRELARLTHDLDVQNSEANNLLRWHIRNLRRKLPQGYLVSVRGIGYMLTIPELDDNEQA